MPPQTSSGESLTNGNTQRGDPPGPPSRLTEFFFTHSMKTTFGVSLKIFQEVSTISIFLLKCD
jgi:hypothetical protein